MLHTQNWNFFNNVINTEKELTLRDSVVNYGIRKTGYLINVCKKATNKSFALISQISMRASNGNSMGENFTAGPIEFPYKLIIWKLYESQFLEELYFL